MDELVIVLRFSLLLVIAEGRLDSCYDKNKSLVCRVIVQFRVLSACVPLHYVMEVNEVLSGPQLVSHEVTSKAYQVSLDGGFKNKERHQRQTAKDVSAHAGHIAQDELFQTGGSCLPAGL